MVAINNGGEKSMRKIMDPDAPSTYSSALVLAEKKVVGSSFTQVFLRLSAQYFVFWPESFCGAFACSICAPVRRGKSRQAPPAPAILMEEALRPDAPDTIAHVTQIVLQVDSPHEHRRVARQGRPREVICVSERRVVCDERCYACRARRADTERQAVSASSVPLHVACHFGPAAPHGGNTHEVCPVARNDLELRPRRAHSRRPSNH